MTDRFWAGFPLCQHLAERTIPEQAKDTCFGLLNLTRTGFVLGGPAKPLSNKLLEAWPGSGFREGSVLTLRRIKI